ncbi:MAG TPA: VCBS repeat-containing protein [Anaerolinea thermolimosa]|uniref:VCBS repeat-containing protein n=1 Tax=Anaerolinea thermolimosa TaxID=229919 RepID=A0A3D1JE10_9CHLR|nr:VCBS repeat-containing protein [Anaerolinea thermolimosa]GAP07609.1 repeat domain-containing protein [Anaerolinea thermolimosa]HCE16664.1 VCBS repeat-containing protein [Anaerolinea thermolimosa]
MRLKISSSHLFRVLAAGLLGATLTSALPARAAPASAPTPPSPAPIYLQGGPPLADLKLGMYSGFTLGDIDGDGDPDALAGEMSGRLVLYRNAGGPNVGAAFYRLPDNLYPGGLLAIDYAPPGSSTYVHPELVDNDRDGDPDLFIAAVNRTQSPPKLVIEYYQNDGGTFNKVSGTTPNVPSIVGITETGSPGLNCRITSPPEYDSNNWSKEIITLAVGDLTGDNILDAVVGVIYSTDTGAQYELLIYKGVAPGVDRRCPVLISNYTSQPQELRLPGARPFPELFDADSDGDLDLFVGLASGVVRYFENTGTPTSPTFTLRTGPANPLNPPGTTDPLAEPDFGAYVVPEFGNLTLDRHPDFAALSGDGQVFAMRYDPSPEVKHFVPWLTPADFLMPLDSGGRIFGVDEGAGMVTFADLDGDGDPDALTGGKDGAIRNYRNLLKETGERRFVELKGNARWFPADPGAFPYGAPLLADFDHQQGGFDDYDLVIAAQLPDGLCPAISTAPAGTGGLPGSTGALATEGFSLSTESRQASPLPPDVPLATGVTGGVTTQGTGVWRLCYYENEGTASQPNFQLNASDSSGRYDPFVDPNTGQPLSISGEYLAPAAVAADDYETYPDLILGTRAGGLIYLHNLGGDDGPLFEIGNPADLGLDTLSIPFGTPVFQDLDGDTSPDLVIGTADGRVRVFHNDQTPDDPGSNANYPIGPFTEITGADNPFAFLELGQYAAPTFADLDSDGDPDLITGSVLNTFRFYENVTPAVPPASPLAFVDYRFNPLGAVIPPNQYEAFYSRSVNFGDVDGDSDLDAFVGSDSGLDYYRNLGTPTRAVFRLQPPERNPLSSIPTPFGVSNVTFADTHPNYPGTEAYVSGYLNGKGYIRGYYYDTSAGSFTPLPSQPFPSTSTSFGFYTNYEVGTRITFFPSESYPCLDAFITLGSFASSGYSSYYAVTQFLCGGLDSNSEPIYTLPTSVSEFEENIAVVSNPFYYLNWRPQNTQAPFNNQPYFDNGEWNGTLAGPSTWWFGNNLGEVQTLLHAFYDANSDAYYINRVTDNRDPFRGVRLPNPTVPTAADTNGDGFVEAYIGSASGAILYLEGSATPPPSERNVYLPLIRK